MPKQQKVKRLPGGSRQVDMSVSLDDRPVIKASEIAHEVLSRLVGEALEGAAIPEGEPKKHLVSCFLRMADVAGLIKDGAADLIEKACTGVVATMRSVIEDAENLHKEVEVAYSVQEELARLKSTDPKDMLRVISDQLKVERDRIQTRIWEEFRLPEEEVRCELDEIDAAVTDLTKTLLEKQGKLELMQGEVASLEHISLKEIEGDVDTVMENLETELGRLRGLKQHRSSVEELEREVAEMEHDLERLGHEKAQHETYLGELETERMQIERDDLFTTEAEIATVEKMIEKRLRRPSEAELAKTAGSLDTALAGASDDETVGDLGTIKEMALVLGIITAPPFTPHFRSMNTLLLVAKQSGLIAMGDPSVDHRIRSLVEGASASPSKDDVANQEEVAIFIKVPGGYSPCYRLGSGARDGITQLQWAEEIGFSPEDENKVRRVMEETELRRKEATSQRYKKRQESSPESPKESAS